MTYRVFRVKHVREDTAKGRLMEEVSVGDGSFVQCCPGLFMSRAVSDSGAGFVCFYFRFCW